MNKQRGFVMMYAYAAVGAVVLLMGLAIKVQTARLDSAKSEHAAFVAQVKAVGEAQERKTKETIARQKRSSDEAEKRSKRTVADIRAKYDQLRSGPSGGDVSSVPSTAPVADDAARDSRLLSLLQIAEEQARRLAELQDWVRGQGIP